MFLSVRTSTLSKFTLLHALRFKLTMNVLGNGQHLQGGSHIVAAVDVQVQQVEGLHSHTGFRSSSLHSALQGAPKDLAGQGAPPLDVLLTPGHVALALARDVLPVLVI